MKRLTRSMLVILTATVWSFEPSLVEAQTPKRQTIGERMRQVGGSTSNPTLDDTAREMEALVGEQRWERAIQVGNSFLKQPSRPDPNAAFGLSMDATAQSRIRYLLATAYLQTGHPAEALPHITASTDLTVQSALGMRSRMIEGGLKHLQTPEGNPFRYQVEQSRTPEGKAFAEQLEAEMKKQLSQVQSKLQWEQSPAAAATRREKALRFLLEYKATSEYTAQVAKLRDVLSKAIDGDPTGGCADSLAMDALVRGDFPAFERFHKQFVARNPNRAEVRVQIDAREVLLKIAQGQAKSIPSAMRSHAEQALQNAIQVPDSLVQMTVTTVFGGEGGGPGGRDDGDYERSYILSSMPSFAAFSPACNQAACEVALMLKKSSSHLMRSQESQRALVDHNLRENETRALEQRTSGNDRSSRTAVDMHAGHLQREYDQRRMLAMLAGSILMARPAANLPQAMSEAVHIYRSSLVHCPGRKSTIGNQDLQSTRVDFAALQRRIKPTEAVLELAVTDVLDLENLRKGLKWKAPRYVGWLIKSSEEPKFIDIGERSEIDRLVTDLQAEVAVAPQRVSSAGDREALQTLESSLGILAKRVLDPVSAELKEITRLTICPDAALWLVPWAAAPISADRVLIDQCEVDYADTLAWKTEPRKVFEGPTTPAVVMADADFDLAPQAILEAEARLLPKGENVDPVILPTYGGKSILPRVGALPGTAAEAQVVADRLRSLGKEPPRVFTRRDALESVVRSVKHPEYLVLAVHGFALPSLEKSANVPANTKRTPVAVAAGSRSFDVTRNLAPGHQVMDLIANPFVRCGLLLSGANNSDKWGEVRSADGILTGMEAALMDLRGTKLVVLSACDTGLGDPTVGEGVAGLRQAFLIAGAESVLASLWQVPDQATADLMGDLFGVLETSESPAAALRKAQLKQIEKRRELYGAAHPYYWAAFTVTGR